MGNEWFCRVECVSPESRWQCQLSDWQRGPQDWLSGETSQQGSGERNLCPRHLKSTLHPVDRTPSFGVCLTHSWGPTPEDRSESLRWGSGVGEGLCPTMLGCSAWKQEGSLALSTHLSSVPTAASLTLISFSPVSFIESTYQVWTINFPMLLYKWSPTNQVGRNSNLPGIWLRCKGYILHTGFD